MLTNPARENAMKKILAALTLVAMTSISVSAFAAGCGNNTSRGSNTNPPPATGTNGGSRTGGGQPR